MPPLLRSNACSYIVQGISTTRSRHPPERQQASRQSAAVFPTIGNKHPDNRQPVFPTPLPHTNQGGTLRVAALQSIMKPILPIIYTYIYIYIYINIKYFFGIYCYWENNCNTATLRGTAYVNSNIAVGTTLPATTRLLGDGTICHRNGHRRKAHPHRPRSRIFRRSIGVSS